MRSCTIRAWRERRRGKNSAAGASRRSDGRAPRAPPGLTAGARPPLPRRWRPREPSARANRPPRGGAGRTAGDAGLGARSFWGGGSVREEAPGRGGASTLRPGGGGARSQGREVGCAGGGTHGRAGEGAHSVRSSVLGPAARPAPQAPNPEPGARSGGPARRPRPHAACGSRPRPLPAAPTPAPAPAPPGLSCVLRPSVRPRRSPASA